MMLHPRYNHLGRSKKKAKKVTKAQELANAAHLKFLESHGLKPVGKRHRLKGVEIREPERLIRRPDLDPTGDHIGTWAAKKELK